MDTLLSHKIEIRPTKDQAEYLDKAFGCRRHCYNQLLAHFSQEDVKYSRKAAAAYYQTLRVKFPWYSEVTQRASGYALGDLHSAYTHFFRRVKQGKKPGYPKFKKRGDGDSFGFCEASKIKITNRAIKVEKLKTLIKMREQVRFTGKQKQANFSKQAGRYYVSILVDVQDYNPKDYNRQPSIGVDFGIKNLATLSTGKSFPANQKLKKKLNKLKLRQRRIAKKQKGSNRRARTKLSISKLHKGIQDQRKATLHELSDYLTSNFDRIVIEDLNVKGMVKNHKLARAISDSGFGGLRSMIEYKGRLRNCDIVIADRFYPSTKLCSSCGYKNNDLTLGTREYNCPECDTRHDRDINAAINLNNYNKTRHASEGEYKRTQELSKAGIYSRIDVDGVNVTICH